MVEYNSDKSHHKVRAKQSTSSVRNRDTVHVFSSGVHLAQLSKQADPRSEADSKLVVLSSRRRASDIESTDL